MFLFNNESNLEEEGFEEIDYNFTEYTGEKFLIENECSDNFLPNYLKSIRASASNAKYNIISARIENSETMHAKRVIVAISFGRLVTLKLPSLFKVDILTNERDFRNICLQLRCENKDNLETYYEYVHNRGRNDGIDRIFDANFKMIIYNATSNSIVWSRKPWEEYGCFYKLEKNWNEVVIQTRDVLKSKSKRFSCRESRHKSNQYHNSIIYLLIVIFCCCIILIVFS